MNVFDKLVANVKRFTREHNGCPPSTIHLSHCTAIDVAEQVAERAGGKLKETFLREGVDVLFKEMEHKLLGINVIVDLPEEKCPESGEWLTRIELE